MRSYKALLSLQTSERSEDSKPRGCCIDIVSVYSPFKKALLISKWHRGHLFVGAKVRITWMVSGLTTVENILVKSKSKNLMKNFGFEACLVVINKTISIFFYSINPLATYSLYMRKWYRRPSFLVQQRIILMCYMAACH